MDATQLTVIVDSDFRAGTDLGLLEIRVSSPDDERPPEVHRLTLVEEGLVEDGAVTLPFSFGVVPRSGGAGRRARVELRGFAPADPRAAPRVKRGAQTSFVSRHNLRLPMYLWRSCEDVDCTSLETDTELTCDRGQCVPAVVDPRALESASPGDELGGLRFQEALGCEAADTTDPAGTTFYVAPDGDDADAGTSRRPWRTLQHAADRVAPGDVVRVAAGRYAGFQLTTGGMPDAPIVFRADEGALIDAPSRAADGIHLSSVSYVTIEGFRIVGVGDTGIAVRIPTDEPATGVVIRDNEVEDIVNTGISVNGTGTLVEANRVRRAGRHGIALAVGGVEGLVVRNNLVEQSTLLGVYVRANAAVTGAAVTGITIEGNRISANGQDGMQLEGVQRSSIRNNLIHGNARNGIIALGDAQGTAELVFVNNTVHVPPDGRWALKISDGTGDNFVFNNILLSDGMGSISRDASTVVHSAANAVVDGFSVDGEASTIGLTQWMSFGTEAESFLTTAASLFVDAEGGEYRLRPDAPARDGGREQLLGHAAPGHDIDGGLRPAGAGIDVGAYERGALASCP